MQHRKSVFQAYRKWLTILIVLSVLFYSKSFFHYTPPPQYSLSTTTITTVRIYQTVRFWRDFTYRHRSTVQIFPLPQYNLSTTTTISTTQSLFHAQISLLVCPHVVIYKEISNKLHIAHDHWKMAQEYEITMHLTEFCILILFFLQKTKIFK